MRTVLVSLSKLLSLPFIFRGLQGSSVYTTGACYSLINYINLVKKTRARNT